MNEDRVEEILKAVKKNPKMDSESLMQLFPFEKEQVEKTEPGKKRKRTQSQWTEEEMDNFIYMVKKGEKIKDIATELRRSKAAVKMKLEKMKKKGLISNTSHKKDIQKEKTVF